jgi:HK97 family phage prohead protease
MRQHKLITLDSIGLKFYEGKQGVFSGYASVFGGVDSYGDTIYPGAYAKTIVERDRPVQLRFNHEQGVIGKWIRIEEDEKGLYVEGELTPGHSKAMDVYASLMHGAISGLSIGYVPKNFVPNEKGGLDLYEIDLFEISVVESPADLAANIGRIKSDIDSANSLKEIETLLRDALGLSKSDATALVSRMRRLSLGEQEAENQKTSDLAALIKEATLKLTKGI